MERLWTRNFIQLTIAMLLLFVGFYLLIPTLPLFIKKLGGTEAEIGFVIGIFTLSAVVIRPIIGTLLDRYGRRPFVLAGIFFFAVVTYLYDWTAGIIALVLLRIIYGVFWAVSTTSMGATIADIIPASRRGEGMGWYGLSMTIGMAIGPMLGLWVVQQKSFHDLFLLSTVLAAGAFVLALLTRVPFQPQVHTGGFQILEKSSLPIAAVIFFLTITYGGITSFLPLFTESIGVNAGTFFLVYAITLTVIRPLSGRLSDRRGEAFVIIPGIVLAVLALFILAFSQSLTGVIATAILYGIGFGSAHPSLQAATIRLAAPERRGIATATFYTAFDLGIGLGSILLGWVSQLAGYQVLYVVCALSALSALVLFTMIAKRLSVTKKTT